MVLQTLAWLGRAADCGSCSSSSRQTRCSLPECRLSTPSVSRPWKRRCCAIMYLSSRMPVGTCGGCGVWLSSRPRLNLSAFLAGNVRNLVVAAGYQKAGSKRRCAAWSSRVSAWCSQQVRRCGSGCGRSVRVRVPGIGAAHSRLSVPTLAATDHALTSNTVVSPPNPLSSSLLQVSTCLRYLHGKRIPC